MGKTLAIYVKFLRDVAYQNLLKSADVSRSYSKNNTGTVFSETRCIMVKSKIYPLTIELNVWGNAIAYT